MSLPLERSEQAPKRSRREALHLLGATAAAGLFLLSESSTSSVQAAPLMQSEALTPWNVIPFPKNRWYPLNPNSAAGPSLEKKALLAFDEANQTNTASEYRAWADQRIARNPAAPAVMEAYGLCHGASIAMLRLAELQALGKISEVRAHEIINDEVLFGLLVGRHMDDIQSRKNPFNEAESVEDFLSKLRSPDVIPGVVEVENGLDGVWYYGAHGYQGASILVSGFGSGLIPVDPKKIIRAFYPISRQEAPPTTNRSLVLETAYLSEWKKGYTNQRVDQLLGY